MFDDLDDIFDIEVDSSPNDRSVSKKDELKHSFVIQKIITSCLANLTKPSLSVYVSALRGSLFFDVAGLPFQTSILAYEKKLNEDLTDFVVKKISEYGVDGSVYYEPITESDLTKTDWVKLQRVKHMFYHTELFYFLEHMLASHSALTKPRDYVPTGEI